MAVGIDDAAVLLVLKFVESIGKKAYVWAVKKGFFDSIQGVSIPILRDYTKYSRPIRCSIRYRLFFDDEYRREKDFIFMVMGAGIDVSSISKRYIEDRLTKLNLNAEYTPKYRKIEGLEALKSPLIGNMEILSYKHETFDISGYGIPYKAKTTEPVIEIKQIELQDKMWEEVCLCKSYTDLAEVAEFWLYYDVYF